MAGLSAPLLAAASRLYAGGWELRRRAYAAGWRAPRRVAARVVSIGNLTVGGAGKTTLALHLAAAAAARGIAAAVVCRRYRPGPAGEGDEERLYRAAVGPAHCFAGTRKWALAEQAAAAGHALVLVDDGFSHWPLARDLDVVLLDRDDLLGGGRMLPLGRLREPLRALQRADVVVISRLRPGDDPGEWIARARPFAPGARWAAARHRLAGVRTPAGQPLAARGAAHVVTATGNPEAVERTAIEAGFSPVTLAAYRDHHWFRAAERARERERARGGTLLLTAKDAVRWPADESAGVGVIDVGWEWIFGGSAVEDAVLAEGA